MEAAKADPVGASGERCGSLSVCVVAGREKRMDARRSAEAFNAKVLPSSE